MNEVLITVGVKMSECMSQLRVLYCRRARPVGVAIMNIKSQVVSPVKSHDNARLSTATTSVGVLIVEVA
jgi:hypothetical protein